MPAGSGRGASGGRVVTALLPAAAPAQVCPHVPPCPAADAKDHDAAKPVRHDYSAGISVLCNGVWVYDDTGETLPSGKAVAPHRPDVPHCTNPDHRHACPCNEES